MFDDGFKCEKCIELRNKLKGDLFCEDHKESFAAKIFIPLKDEIEKRRLKLIEIVKDGKTDFDIERFYSKERKIKHGSDTRDN